MSSTIEETKSGPPARRRDSKYPWDKWLNGDEWTLEQGRHFHAAPDSFRTMVIREAKARNLTIWTRIQRKEGVVNKVRPRFVRFQATPKSD